VLTAVVSTHGWTDGVSVAYFAGGALGLVLLGAAVLRDLRRFSPVSQRWRSAVLTSVVAVAIACVALGTSARLAFLGVLLGAAAVLGLSALVNLFDAPDPRRPKV
jgi:hypothetical protein